MSLHTEKREILMNEFFGYIYKKNYVISSDSSGKRKEWSMIKVPEPMHFCKPAGVQQVNNYTF